MAGRGFVRLDKVLDHVENIYAAVDLDNGQIVQMTGVTASDGESFQVAAPTDVTSAYSEVMIHVSVPIVAYEPKNFDDFYLVAGKVGRAYYLRSGDIFTISKNMFTSFATIATGDTVVPVNASLKLAEGTPSTQSVAFKVIDTETIGSTSTDQIDCFVLKVL